MHARKLKELELIFSNDKNSDSTETITWKISTLFSMDLQTTIESFKVRRVCVCVYDYTELSYLNY